MRSSILVVILLFGTLLSQAQVLVNRTSVADIGQQTTIVGFRSTGLDEQGNFYTASDIQISGFQEDFAVSKFSADLSKAWEVQYNNLTNGTDYGTDICAINGYAYVTGVSIDSGTTISHFTTLKLDTTDGTILWTATYTAPYAGYAVPTRIRVDGSGNVYVAGTEQTDSNDYAMTLVKYNSSGTQQWVAHYDSLGFYDGAAALTIGSYVSITGFSGTAYSSWDFATASFDPSTGALHASNRAGNGNGSFSKPVDLVKDQYGNLFVLGTSQVSGTNTDIKLIKYDEACNELWVKTWGDSLLPDVAEDMDYEARSGKIVITGTVANHTGGTDMVVVKYDTAGTKLWDRVISSPNPGYQTSGKVVSIDDMGDPVTQGTIYLSGKQFNGTDFDALTLSYDTGGSLRWIKTYDRGAGNNEESYSLLHGGGSVIVLGASKGNDTLYLATQYEEFAKNVLVVYDSINDSTQMPLYFKDQLIVKFKPEIINRSFVDDKEQEFTTLDSLLTSEALAYILTIIKSSDFYNAKVEKIFKHMTLADSISIDRLGDTVQMEPFWSAFLLHFPPNTSVQSIQDSLNSQDSVTAIFNYVEFANKNWIGTLDGLPNDNYLSQAQSGLIATTTFPEADINLEPAWDIYPECGNEAVRVGIFDVPIYWAHPEFGNGTYAGSKIKGGWDFVTNVHISNFTTPSTPASHATEIAGIVGALRNNHIGIAGIAGGDIDNFNNTGCQLFSMGISAHTLVAMSTISSAIVEGAVFNPTSGYGYGLHIQNHSWGTYAGAPGENTTQSDIDLLHDAVKTCHLNRCAFIASRGNFADGTVGAPTDIRYPACFEDDYVICVGSSGNDGEYLDHANTGTNDWQAMYDHGVDLVAPGDKDLIFAPIWVGHPDLFGEDCNSNNLSYRCVSGTSFSAPHVAGVAALMMSMHNTIQSQGYPNNLDNDDIQHLMVSYATTLSSGSQYVGSGRLNAGTTMEMINRPARWVQHIANSTFSSRGVGTTALTQISLASNRFGLQPGFYLAELSTITCTFHNVLSPTSIAIDFWGRNRLNWGCSSSTGVTGEPWADYQFSTNDNEVDLTTITYAWCVKKNIYGQTLADTWIPRAPDAIKTDYSLHIYDDDATDVNDLRNNSFFISLFPNPASNKVWISFKVDETATTILQISSVTGEVVKKQELRNLSTGQHFYSINTEAIAEGIYFVSLTSNKDRLSKKLLITH